MKRRLLLCIIFSLALTACDIPSAARTDIPAITTAAATPSPMPALPTPAPAPTPAPERILRVLPLNPQYDGPVLTLPDGYVETELTGPWALTGRPVEFALSGIAERMWEGRAYVPIEMWPPGEEAYALYADTDEAVDAIGHNEILTHHMLSKSDISYYWQDNGAIQPASFDIPASEDAQEALSHAAGQIDIWLGSDAFTRNLTMLEESSVLKSKDRRDGMGTPIRAYRFIWEPESAKTFAVDGPQGSGVIFARYTGEGIVSFTLSDWTEYAPDDDAPAYDTLTAAEALHAVNYSLSYQEGEGIMLGLIEGVKSIRPAYSSRFGGIYRAWEVTLSLRDEGGKAPMYPTNEYTLMVDMRTGRVAAPGGEAFMRYDGLYPTPYLDMDASLDTGDDAPPLTWNGAAAEIPDVSVWEYTASYDGVFDFEAIASRFFEGYKTKKETLGARVSVILPAANNPRGRFAETMSGWRQGSGDGDLSYSIDRNEHVPARVPFEQPLEAIQRQTADTIAYAFGPEFVQNPRPLVPLYDTADGGRPVDDVYFFAWDQALEGLPVRYNRIEAEVTHIGIERLSAYWGAFEPLPGAVPDGLLSFEQALKCVNFARGVLNQGHPHQSLGDYDQISAVGVEYTDAFSRTGAYRPVYVFTLRKSANMVEFPVLIDPVSGDCFAEEAGIVASPFRLR